MNLRTIVWREIWERPAAMATSLMAVLLAVAALVAIRHITVFSKRGVAQQLEALGANLLILPKSATVQNYYAADLQQKTLPEEYVSQVMIANLPGVEKLSPKLSIPVTLRRQQVTLTGILPQSEFRNKAAWQSVTLFPKKHAGCRKAVCGPQENDTSPESLATTRSIDQLGDDELVVGADVAGPTDVRPGSQVRLMGRPFKVVAVLPRGGTVDDGRVFAHLHSVQDLAKAGEVVNVIEVIGCCEDAAGELVDQLQALLPEAKVVTISQVVSTQVGVNRLIGQLSWLVLAIVIAVGGASMATTISANVRERRREIGTLMAMGATSRFIGLMFLLKAVALGTVGGFAGAVLGVLAAILLGPQWVGIRITPLPLLGVGAVTAALVVSVAAALWPARCAAKLDPCVCFKEV